MGLEVKGLEVFLGGKHILKGIDLEIRTGEFFSLLGASGCGKSTLLKTIAGLIQEQAGQIILDGNKLHCLAPQKRGVVIMFQDKRLFPNLDVGENVAFAARNKGARKAERHQIASRYLKLVQLEGFETRRIHELSGGQQQRVALARALAAQPGVLLLDEPFSALDMNLRGDMRELVSGIQAKTGITMVMVTHDQTEAFSMSDRVALMADGEILQVGTPEEVYEHPCSSKVASYFVDEAPMRRRSQQLPV